MLQRAATNAYSWWWASHIRTKQSKWLDQNLQDMEEKVEYILKIIDEDGDSFAKRAEMYYRKRPEIVNFVEDSFGNYRALADRYDHLSRELQSANRTIATVYPERVQLAMDDEEEEETFTLSISKNSNQPNKAAKSSLPAAPKLSIPKIPSFSHKNSNSKIPSRLMSKKGLIKINSSIGESPAAAASAPSSGLSQGEALLEIDKLQKGILALQTEKEFIKSSYENGLSKYWNIENKVNEMQGRISSLQDEFGIGTVIEDDEARSLMAATALKSCQETLVRLQQKQENSTEEAKREYLRIQEAQEKFKSLKNRFIHSQTPPQGISEEHRCDITSLHSKNPDRKVTRDFETIRGNIKYKLGEYNGDGDGSSLTMTVLAEKVDELVDKVIHLETAVSCQASLVSRLRSEANELQAQIESLEEKETLIEGSNKIRQLEEELQRVQSLNQSFKEQTEHLQTHFVEATSELDILSEKLPNVKLDLNLEDLKMDLNKSKAEEEIAVLNCNPKEVSQEQDVGKTEDFSLPNTSKQLDNVSNEMNIEKDMKIEESEEVLAAHETTMDSASFHTKEENYANLNSSLKHDDLSDENGGQKRQDLIQTMNRDHHKKPETLATEEEEEEEEEDEENEEPDWRKLFLEGLDDREKILLKEYTSILRNYKELKKKLSLVEKKNRANMFKSAVDLKVLRHANATKDAEIQSLHEKMSLLQMTAAAESKESHEETTSASIQEGLDEKPVPFGDFSPRSDPIPFGDFSPRSDQKEDPFGDFCPRSDQKEVPFGDFSPRSDQKEVQFGDSSPNSNQKEEVPLCDSSPHSTRKKVSNDNPTLSSAETKVPSSDHKAVPDGTSSPSSTENVVPETGNIQTAESINNLEETTEPEDMKISTTQEEEGIIKDISVDESHVISTIEEKIRMDIDALLEENIEFWLKFSNSFHQIEKFRTAVEDLMEELAMLKEKKKQNGSSKNESLNSEIRPIYRHLREIQTELTVWLEHNAVMKDDLQSRLSSLSSIQEEISRLSGAKSEVEGTELSDYQAAKFQGEVLNMKQETNKVGDELLTGLQRASKFQADIEKTLAELDEELGISAAKNNQTKNSSSRSRIPLRSFLFGVKLKRQRPAFLACMTPALQKQYSDLAAIQK